MAEKHDDAKNTKNKRLKIVRAVFIVMALVIAITAGAGAGVVATYVSTAPKVNAEDITGGLALTSKIYDKDGSYVESLHGVENREYVGLSKISKFTQDAFIAIEDERFRDHPGIDIKRIFGALWADIKAGRPDQGASTITQQLIKNTVLTPKKELKRKVQEAYLAVKLEREISKDQILEYYLNTIYLGGSAYGVQAAAEYYFDKNADELTIAESALVAGLTQSPSKYNPYNNEKTPEVYRNRQLIVLSKMLEHNMITKDEYEKAKSEKLIFKKRDDASTLKYQWFVEAVLDSLYDDFKAKYDYTSDEIYQKIYSGGLKIQTTLDPEVQEVVEKAANDPKYYPSLAKDIATWGKDNIIQPQIGIVINDYKTGEIRAVVGGRGKQSLRSQNRATDPVYARQPGSAMKPIAVYGPAFDMGYATANVIDDSPFTPEQSSAALGWPKEGPHNYDDRYRGLTTIRDAVIRSSNVVAAKLMLQIGTDTSTEYIKKFGISTLVLSGDNNDNGAAKALGGLTKGVTPLEMSGAYGVFGNGGSYIQPVLYTKVLDKDGNVILEKNQEKHQVISPQAAYMAVDVLKDVINKGTGTAVMTKGKFTSMPSAGKTGTTEKQGDAYFAGLTPYYSGVIWMGHDKPSQRLNLTSAETAWMWGDIMRQIHKSLSVKNFDTPDGLVKVAVCRDSCKLPTDLCAKDPRGSRIITDIFEKDKVPTESCDTHVSVLINTITGKRASIFTPPFFTEEKIYIKRPYPVDSRVEDHKYEMPSEIDTMPQEDMEPNDMVPGKDKLPDIDIKSKIEKWFKRGKKKK